MSLLSSLRAGLRPPLARALWPVLRPLRAVLERGRDGSRLRPGITAVVAARDEAYTLPFCLRSLVGFADQVVCIDNGSRDATRAAMDAFRDEHGGRLAVDIVSLPDALLGDCREAGLRLTRHSWHLRWDADLVAKTSGPESILALRERLLADERPRTVQLPRTNLYGDLRHALRHQAVVDPGEPILVRFGRGIEYREFGRFDAVRVPLHYVQRQEAPRYYFHLAGLKSDDNLIHRFHYFNWRERVNREGASLEPALRDLGDYKRRMNQELFGTNEPRSLKFRFRRQLCYLLAPYEPERHGAYPEVLAGALQGRPRFEVVYRDGRPWTRLDHEDGEMRGYEPTAEDLAWDPEGFLRHVLGPEQCRLVGIAPAPPRAGG